MVICWRRMLICLNFNLNRTILWLVIQNHLNPITRTRGKCKIWRVTVNCGLAKTTATLSGKTGSSWIDHLKVYYCYSNNYIPKLFLWLLLSGCAAPVACLLELKLWVTAHQGQRFLFLFSPSKITLTGLQFLACHGVIYLLPCMAELQGMWRGTSFRDGTSPRLAWVFKKYRFLGLLLVSYFDLECLQLWTLSSTLEYFFLYDHACMFLIVSCNL